MLALMYVWERKIYCLHKGSLDRVLALINTVCGKGDFMFTPINTMCMLGRGTVFIIVGRGDRNKNLHSLILCVCVEMGDLLQAPHVIGQALIITCVCVCGKGRSRACTI